GLLPGGDVIGHFVLLVRPRAVTANAVDAFAASGCGDPGGRVGGYALARPVVERLGEGVLHRLLGEVEVAEDADQGRQDRAGLLAKNAFDRNLWRWGRRAHHSATAAARSNTGRTSTPPPSPCAAFNSRAKPSA